MVHYAGRDGRINAGWPAYEAALKTAGKDYSAFMYPGANHGLHSDTPPRYDPEAATLARQRTLGFFDPHLN